MHDILRAEPLGVPGGGFLHLPPSPRSFFFSLTLLSRRHPSAHDQPSQSVRDPLLVKSMDRRPRPSPGSASLPEPDRTRPELKTADRDRQRGTYSYHRLDDRVCGPAFVGGAALGNVQVDLKWNFRLSQWGCIGGDRPAGILYLDIGLHQQADYKLVSITVEVMLEDIPTEEDDGDGISNPHREIPVQMTDWFGPKHVVGREHVQNFTHESKFQPTSFEGPRIGIGDMGKSSQLESLLRSRWGFDGRLKRPNRTKARSAGGTHYKVRTSLVARTS